MPPQVLFNLSEFDLDGPPQFDIQAIRQYNQQRGDMEQLTGVIAVRDTRVLAYKDVRDDEFWVTGHIPGRPLFPGVLMIEAAAQAASIYTRVALNWDGFVGFGGVSDVKFRQQVPPGVRLYLLLRENWRRHKRVCCDAQGLVNGNVVFEGQITGVVM